MSRADEVPITVLMPVYNVERYLRGALESVFRQTWQDFELLVVNDGSTDGTRAILAETRDPRVRVDRHAPRRARGRASLRRGAGAGRVPRQDGRRRRGASPSPRGPEGLPRPRSPGGPGAQPRPAGRSGRPAAADGARGSATLDGNEVAAPVAEPDRPPDGHAPPERRSAPTTSTTGWSSSGPTSSTSGTGWRPTGTSRRFARCSTCIGSTRRA